MAWIQEIPKGSGRFYKYYYDRTTGKDRCAGRVNPDGMPYTGNDEGMYEEDEYIYQNDQDHLRAPDIPQPTEMPEQDFFNQLMEKLQLEATPQVVEHYVHPEYELTIVQQQGEEKLIITPKDHTDFDMLKESALLHDAMHPLTIQDQDGVKSLIISTQPIPEEDRHELHLSMLQDGKEIGATFYNLKTRKQMWGGIGDV